MTDVRRANRSLENLVAPNLGPKFGPKFPPQYETLPRIDNWSYDNGSDIAVDGKSRQTPHARGSKRQCTSAPINAVSGKPKRSCTKIQYISSESVGGKNI